MEVSIEQLTDYKNLSELLKEKNIQQKQAIDDLLENIKNDEEKIKDKLFIISAAYDTIYRKYYAISLSILILSSVVTFIEALRLSIIDYVNKQTLMINEQLLTFIMNLIVLCVGTVITILSSIIRFKNYREILEQLREKQNIIIDYKDKYNKKHEQVLYLSTLKEITNDEIKAVVDKVGEYHSEIKSMNILQYLRNKDIILYNKYKAHFELELKKIELEKKLTMHDYEENIKAKRCKKTKHNTTHYNNVKNNDDNDEIISIHELT